MLCHLLSDSTWHYFRLYCIFSFCSAWCKTVGWFTLTYEAFINTGETTIKCLLNQIYVVDSASDIIEVEKIFRKQIIAIIKKTNNRQSWQTNGGNREEKRK